MFHSVLIAFLELGDEGNLHTADKTNIVCSGEWSSQCACQERAFMLPKDQGFNVRQVYYSIHHDKSLFGKLCSYFTNSISLEKSYSDNQIHTLLGEKTMEFFHFRYFSGFNIAIFNAELFFCPFQTFYRWVIERLVASTTNRQYDPNS